MYLRDLKKYNDAEMEMKCNLWINDKNTIALDLAIPYSNSLILKLETGMIWIYAKIEKHF